MITYQEAQPLYRRLGWPSLLPLAAGTKYPPPTGFTGWDGIDPSFADCMEFNEVPAYRGTCQAALRVPSIVIGLDTDAYGGKTGGRTFAEAWRRWGPLDGGPWSSARDDGVSGIRFFRVPDGTVLVSNIAFPELELGHIEVIQRHHRYAAVWPSIHPTTSTPYTWRNTAGPDQPPAVADLPELPSAWLVGLAGTGRQGERAQPEQVARFLAELPAGDACPAVRATLKAAFRAMTIPERSRHDATCAAVLRLLRIGEQGHPGATVALDALRVAFVRHVVADGSRTTAAAGSEFDRMREGQHGIGLIETTPTPDGQRGCRCAQNAPTRPGLIGITRKVLTADPEERKLLLGWAQRKFRWWADAGQLDEVYARQLYERLRVAARGGSESR